MIRTGSNESKNNTDLIERLARHDQLIVLAAVSLVVVLAGLYTVLGVGMKMSALDMTLMPQPTEGMTQMGSIVNWTPAYGLLVVLMWWIMMIAMMTPSAAPTLLLFVALKRHGKNRKNTTAFSSAFLMGYLLIWALFAVIATFLQWGLGIVGLLSISMMTISSKVLAGSILIGAGLYQFSDLKNSCLKHCRSPAIFLTENNRSGLDGALITGAHHGIYCLGCCWALMALLFVGGIMNLYWIAGLAIYVVVEKVFPSGLLLSRVFGAALILIGVFYVLLQIK